MSAQEIIEELPRLTEDERAAIARRLAELPPALTSAPTKRFVQRTYRAGLRPDISSTNASPLGEAQEEKPVVGDPRQAPVNLPSRVMGLKPGINLTKALALAAEMEDEEILAKMRRNVDP